jgi:hypothetical protein
MDSAAQTAQVTHKHSRKTESLPYKKQPLKLFSHVTNGFVSPC